MKSINEIKDCIRMNWDVLERKYQINEIGFFGSYARGEQNEKSDIDVLVSFKEIPSLLKFLEMENFLSETLSIKTDLVRKESIRRELKEQILIEVIYI